MIKFIKLDEINNELIKLLEIYIFDLNYFIINTKVLLKKKEKKQRV